MMRDDEIHAYLYPSHDAQRGGEGGGYTEVDEGVLEEGLDPLRRLRSTSKGSIQGPNARPNVNGTSDGEA